jgi:hypothetical protein
VKEASMKRLKRMSAWGLAAVAAALSACSSTMLVSKDGKGYFLGSGSNAAYRMLCESGDLRKVLADTRLPEGTREDLYKYNCSSERSGDRVKQIYAALTAAERKDLRLAFTRNGYDINYLPC